jgi:hypothetical protein
MPWHTRLAAPLVLAAAALACSEQSEMQMTEPEAQITGGPACKLSDLRNAAKNFFGLRTQGYTVASQFTTQNANTTAALPIFFNLAQEIAQKAGTSGLNTTQAALGAEVHRQAVACAPVADPDYNDNMDNVEAALGPNGAYEVRGRLGSTNANAVVLSHNVGQHGSSGIKAPSDGFNAWTGGPAVFYGFTEFVAQDGEAAADPNFPATFQWHTVRPAGVEYSLTLRGLVGMCVSTTTAGLNGAQFRIQHEAGTAATVLPVTTFDVCTRNSPTHTSSLSPISNAFAWLRQHLAPAPLQAASAALTTSPSGSIKKFSPVEPVNPGGATLEFVPSPIPDTPIDEGLGVKVRATGAQGVPWEGLNIKLIAFNNNGSWELTGDEAVTNEQGEADFTQSILDKPGVYQLLAITQPGLGGDPDAGGFAQDSVTSGNFHRTPN